MVRAEHAEHNGRHASTNDDGATTGIAEGGRVMVRSTTNASRSISESRTIDKTAVR